MHIRLCREHKAKPHGCCIFSMTLHEAPSMETTTPKGEWFPCWVAEWSIMENMQQQMWFCFYPSPISINISIYVYNALRLTPEIWFWAMPFASFQIDINKYFAIVSPRCQVISNCEVMSPWITWHNNRLMISRFAILSHRDLNYIMAGHAIVVVKDITLLFYHRNAVILTLL